MAYTEYPYEKQQYERKVWDNVPDPSNYEGNYDLNSLPRFDAENMNRIEDGIEEALSSVGEHTHSIEEVGLTYVEGSESIIDIAIDDQVPAFEKAQNLENLKPGEDSISTAFGKIKKAIADFMTHKNDGNPHNITPDKIKAAASSHNHDDKYYTKSGVDSKLSGKAASSHTHDDRYYTGSEVDSKLSGKAASSHTHDERYYTETEVNNLLANKAPAYSYGTEDLVPGQSPLTTGKLHFVYE